MHYREYFEDPPHYGTACALPFLPSRPSVYVLCGTTRGGEGGHMIKRI
jgi:hypothetical protein